MIQRTTKNVTFYHNTSNHIEYRVAVETIQNTIRTITHSLK